MAAIKERLSGNEAVAIAMRQINPDVVPAFPITPSTEVPQYFSSYIAQGMTDTEFIPVESEHSAMSACIGSQSAGARTMTATSSCGLALMWEMLYVAASLKLPITMACVNRALSGPININADHSDSMGARDAGWIQIYSEDNQEAYDNMIQAVRIAEHKDVQLPVMVCQDGFITSHAVENLDILEDEDVKGFVREYQPPYSLLSEDNHLSLGPYATSAYYMESKRQQLQGMINARDVILRVAREYEAMTGRAYGFFEEYRLDDAEFAVVLINSAAGTAKTVVDDLRQSGVKAGLLKIRVFRPFPFDEIREALSHLKAVAVMDRSEGMSGCGGPLFAEVRSAMFESRRDISLINYIYGLGGRDVRTRDIASVYQDLMDLDAGTGSGEIFRYLGLRG